MTDWDRLSEEEKDDLAAEFPPEQLYDEDNGNQTYQQWVQSRNIARRIREAERAEKGKE